MKKLKLDSLNLVGSELLNRQQLKMIVGGSGGGEGGYCFVCSSPKPGQSPEFMEGGACGGAITMQEANSLVAQLNSSGGNYTYWSHCEG